MHPWNLAKLFFRMFTLRAKPSDLPYSMTLLLILSTVFLLTKSLVYLWFIHIVNRFDTHELISLSLSGASIIALMWLLILFAVLRTTLLYYSMVERFVQLATSFVAMDCMLTGLFLIWLTVLDLVQLPLATASFGSIGIILGLVLMMYWQFMVYIHLLIYSMNISILKAGVFALFYMLLQHNLAEVLLNVVIKVQGH